MYELLISKFDPDALNINHMGVHVDDLDETILLLHN